MQDRGRCPELGAFLEICTARYTSEVRFSLRVIGRLPSTDRATRPDGRRPISLEGGNRGEVRDAAGVGLWGFDHREKLEVGGWRFGATRIGGDLVDKTSMRQRFASHYGGMGCARYGVSMIAGQARRWLAREPTCDVSKGGTWRVCGGGHELSIRIRCVGRCRGAQPRSNVSMTIMRPPQHGQGGEDGWGSPSSAQPVSTGCRGGSGTWSN